MEKGLWYKLIFTILALAAPPALAQSEGDWTFGVGIGQVSADDSGEILGGDIDVDDDWSAIFTIEYFVANNLGIELFASLPFEHDISVDGVGDFGSFKYIPAALTLNYHFPTNSRWTPYVGGGVNYTNFFEEESDAGPFSFTDTWGLTAQVGVDYQVSDTTALRFNIRWFEIETDVLVDRPVGEVSIDPYLIGLSYVFQF